MHPSPTLRYRVLLIAAIFGFVLWSAPSGLAGQKDQMGNMPGMDMSRKGSKNPMGDMGASMAAMAGHMVMTPLRPKQPGDEERAKAVVAEAKATMER